jgi:hypothetical protein
LKDRTLLRQSSVIKTNNTNPIPAMAATSRLPVSSLTIQPETVQKRISAPAADLIPSFRTQASTSSLNERGRSMSKIYAIIYLSIFLEVSRRSGRLTKVDSRIAMSLKKWLKKSSKVLIRAFSLFSPSRIVFRLLPSVHRAQYGFRRNWGLSMPLTKGIDHLCYSLRPVIVQTKLAREIFYLRLSDPFCYDLVLGKNEPIIGEWLSENVTKGIIIVDVGSNIWFHTLRIAALIGAPTGSGRSNGEFQMFAFATGLSEQPGSGALARTLWFEPDGRSHRRFPVGVYQSRNRP